MSFQIIEILDSQPDKVLAKVSHQDNQLTATIFKKEAEDLIVGKSFQAEIDYDRILDWKAINNFDDSKSGIQQKEDGFHLFGKVHNIVDLGNDRAVVDIYIQNGPEFFTVKSEEIDNEVPNLNTGLEIVVSNLYIYPNHK